MAKATASIILKQQVMAPTLQSHETQTSGSILRADKVNQTACLSNLKLKSLANFNIRKTLPRGMDEFYIYTTPVCQPIGMGDDYYDSNDSATFLRDLHCW